ncbi:uncharacterized protein V6R79_024846 [Siganus canaliculatus]
MERFEERLLNGLICPDFINVLVNYIELEGQGRTVAWKHPTGRVLFHVNAVRGRQRGGSSHVSRRFSSVCTLDNDEAEASVKMLKVEEDVRTHSIKMAMVYCMMLREMVSRKCQNNDDKALHIENTLQPLDTKETLKRTKQAAESPKKNYSNSNTCSVQTRTRTRTCLIQRNAENNMVSTF